MSYTVYRRSLIVSVIGHSQPCRIPTAVIISTDLPFADLIEIAVHTPHGTRYSFSTKLDRVSTAEDGIGLLDLLN